MQVRHPGGASGLDSRAGGRGVQAEAPTVTPLDVLDEILSRLHELGIAYALTGSYASTYW